MRVSTICSIKPHMQVTNTPRRNQPLSPRTAPGARVCVPDKSWTNDTLPTVRTPPARVAATDSVCQACGVDATVARTGGEAL
jgi:hypothetical protein